MEVCNKARLIKAVCRSIPWLALFLTLGCAPAARHENNASTTIKPLLATSAVPVQVAQEAGGFTITQSVPVTDAVRADYESARTASVTGTRPHQRRRTSISGLHTRTPATWTTPKLA